MYVFIDRASVGYSSFDESSSSSSDDAPGEPDVEQTDPNPHDLLFEELNNLRAQVTRLTAQLADRRADQPAPAYRPLYEPGAPPGLDYYRAPRAASPPSSTSSSESSSGSEPFDGHAPSKSLVFFFMLCILITDP